MTTSALMQLQRLQVACWVAATAARAAIAMVEALVAEEPAPSAATALVRAVR